jgi:hypothetical protein
LPKRLLFALATALASTCLSIPAMADSFTYTLNIDHCTGGCGSSPFGTITVSDVAGGVQMTIALNSGNDFVLTGQAASTLGFNLAGNPNNVTLVSSALPGWSLDSPSAGSLQFDGFGNFEYSLNCCFGNNGGANAQPSPETLVLSGTGLTAASFQELSTGGSPSVFFALDVLSAQTGNTGPVGTNTPPTGTVPEPGSIVLLSSITAAIVGITRRKRTA